MSISKFCVFMCIYVSMQLKTFPASLPLQRLYPPAHSRQECAGGSQMVFSSTCYEWPAQNFKNCLKKCHTFNVFMKWLECRVFIFHCAALAMIILKIYRRVCLKCFCKFSSVMQPDVFAFADVFCRPPQISAGCQESVLVWGIHWEYHFGSLQDKLVCTLLKALPDCVSALEEHFPRTLVSPRWETLPHAVPSLFLYHWPTKVWHDGPVWQTEAAP